LLNVLRLDSSQTVVFSEEFKTELLTTLETCSIELLYDKLTLSCSFEKEVTPKDPFCNFLARAFKIELNFGKKIFKKIK
jgi:hypothetical protein